LVNRISANFIEYLSKEPEQLNNDNKCICSYCEKSFTRIDSLKKHLSGRCKSKDNHDELEKLKEEMKFIIEGFKNLQNNYQIMENENIKLKNEIEHCCAWLRRAYNLRSQRMLHRIRQG
jgi:predicted glycosyltransferase